MFIFYNNIFISTIFIVLQQNIIISSATAIRSLFLQQYRRFLKLFFNKAYLWQYLEANAELDDFYEAKEAVRGLIDSYEELLTRSVDVEDPGGKKRLEVRGETTPIPPLGREMESSIDNAGVGDEIVGG